MPNVLRFKVEPCLDEVVRLTVEVESLGFAGRGSSEFHIREVRDFVERISRFDIPRFAPVVMEGGYWDTKEEGKVLETHLFLGIYPIEPMGDFGIRVKLSTPPHLFNRPESVHAVEAELEADHEALRELAANLEALLDGRSPEAVLIAKDRHHFD